MQLHHPYLVGVLIVGINQYGYITPASSGSPYSVEFNTATSSIPSRCPRSGEKSIRLHQAGFLGVPIVGRNQYGYITTVF